MISHSWFNIKIYSVVIYWRRDSFAKWTSLSGHDKWPVGVSGHTCYWKHFRFYTFESGLVRTVFCSKVPHNEHGHQQCPVLPRGQSELSKPILCSQTPGAAIENKFQLNKKASAASKKPVSPLEQKQLLR